MSKITKLLFLLKLVLFLIFRNNRKIVFLFGAPSHSNLGDQTQCLCIKRWFNLNFPEYFVYEFPQNCCDFYIQKVVSLFIWKEDKIVCHSGYHLTDIYPMENIYRTACQLFVKFSILILPQTINYKSEERMKDTAEILGKHGNVLLMVRDKVSYEIAKRFFSGCKLLLYPDIVTSLIGIYHFSNKREGILFCTRNDVEAFYSHEQIEDLRRRFDGHKTEITDTTLKLQAKYIKKYREKVLEDIISSYAHYRLVITDRYHGTIISLIAGTPVIVLKTSDHKLSSGVDWFPESFHDYVRLADNLDKAYEIAQEMLKTNLTYRLPSYFKENYYDKLKIIIENA